MVNGNGSLPKKPSDADDSGISFDSDLHTLVVVAHPDDETLWTGGTILMYPNWTWSIISLCRGGDADRRPKFFKAMRSLASSGIIGDLDDGPDQRPLPSTHIQEAIRQKLETTNFDLIVTHSPFGEYTRHLRHEEVGLAVLHLWREQFLSAKELWMFAYTDNAKTHHPKAIEDAHLNIALPANIWQKKLDIIEQVYGFKPTSWEALTTPKQEAFWRFKTPTDADVWYKKKCRPTKNATTNLISTHPETRSFGVSFGKARTV